MIFFIKIIAIFYPILVVFCGIILWAQMEDGKINDKEINTGKFVGATAVAAMLFTIIIAAICTYFKEWVPYIMGL